MNPYVLTFKSKREILLEFKKIGVDRDGADIMKEKGFIICVKLCQVTGFCANILKQEMLSLGGDVAVSRGTLTGKDKKTDCLILGNISQLLQLSEKLKRQPFGLSFLGDRIRVCVNNYEREEVVLGIGRKKMRLGKRTLVMGVINATFDSFSGDGILAFGTDKALLLARKMVRDGADILDVGGVSTRPGSRRVSLKEELRRVVPVLRVLRKNIGVPLSVDTTSSDVAHAALDIGVSIVNDVSALRFDKKMAKIVCRYKAALVLMHMKGIPLSMQKDPKYNDLPAEIFSFLYEAINRAEDAGIRPENIIIDPGIGFGKRKTHNLEILGRLDTLKSLGRPILVGVSRKRFIGDILNADIKDRTVGTLAAVSIAVANGADIVRVHDVKEAVQAVRISDAIIRGGYDG